MTPEKETDQAEKARLECADSSQSSAEDKRQQIRSGFEGHQREASPYWRRLKCWKAEGEAIGLYLETRDLAGDQSVPSH